MSVVVVNVRRERPAGMVYIGRTCSGLAGSVLGNPFKRRAGQAPGSTLDDYRAWLRDEYRKNGAVRRELERLADLAEQGQPRAGLLVQTGPRVTAMW